MNNFFEVIIETHFEIDIESTLFSGQSFSWNKIENKESSYSSTIDSNALIISQIKPNIIEVKCTSNTLFKLPLTDFIYQYLSLDINPDLIFSDTFKNRYPHLWLMVKPHLNLRVLRQEPFEIMVTFMCAQGIGMGLIRRQVSMITERFGSKIIIESDNGTLELHTFPSPATLAAAGVPELSACTNNNRIRAANIIAVAQAYASGTLAIDCVQSGNCRIDTLAASLCRHRGIGMKIADCIALFGLGRFDAFPIDTHVRQYLWEWFGIEAARKSLTERNYRYLQEAARNILGEQYAGYAGHILFHCWRKEVRKMTAF